jgi:hypothetical protein
VGAQVEDDQQVGVAEAAGGASLLREARQAFGIRREARRQDLDGDLAPDARVASAVDLAHPSGSERRDHLVGPDVSARLERHTGAA